MAAAPEGKAGGVTMASDQGQLQIRTTRLRRYVALLDARVMHLLASGRPGRSRQAEIVRLEDLRGAALRRLAEMGSN